MKSYWLQLLWTSVLLIGIVQGLLSPDDQLSQSAGKSHDKRQIQGFISTLRHISKPSFVWRGEFGRTPEDIKAAHGFYARGFQKAMKGETFTPKEREEGASLYHHTTTLTSQYTKWVSTSSSPTVAFNYATSKANGGDAFVYRIHTDRRFVDVIGTLGKHFRTHNEYEHAAAGFISYNQIHSWVRIEPGMSLDQFVDAASDEVKAGVQFIANEDYDSEKYENQLGIGPQYQLAGFPKSSESWKDEVYKEYRDQKVSSHFAKLVLDTLCDGDQRCFKELLPHESLTPNKASRLVCYQME
ncbi:putative enterotoxin [Cordyceps sp. RAO-2017]|nr:putative enterotoxin [Cordyceps sp. RAO-2017]